VHRPAASDVRAAVLDSALLALASLLSYWLVAVLLARLHSVSRIDDIVGGLWAAIAAIVVGKTMFGSKDSRQQSVEAAISRVAATLVSFALCLIYLIFLPVHLWAFALLIGLSALLPTLAGRPGDAATAAITTAVLLGLAPLNPHQAWEQPILRLADTIVGVVVGVAAAWLSRRFLGRLASSDEERPAG
jgi:uncharacterized membrane protein YccC